MAANAFQKFKDSTSRAITKISVKTSSSMEKSKLKMRIETLNRDVQMLCTSIGESMYVLWIQGQSADQNVINKLEMIKQKKAEIAQINAEINAIDERDNEILGNRSEYQAMTMQSMPAQPAQPVQNVPVQPLVAAAPEAVARPMAAPAAAVCPGCGEAHDGVAKFCRKCGYNLQG